MTSENLAAIQAEFERGELRAFGPSQAEAARAHDAVRRAQV